MIIMIENNQDFINQLKEMAWSSEDAYSFYVDAYMTMGNDVLEYVNKNNYEDVYILYNKDKPKNYKKKYTSGIIDEYFKLHNLYINITKFEVADLYTYNKSNTPKTAEALTEGLIAVNIDDPYFSKRIFDHEIGHQLCLGNRELAIAVQSNYGDAFGEFNGKNCWGLSYNPEESFADAYSYYMNNKLNYIKRIYPKSVDVITHIVNNISNLKQIQQGFYKAFEDTFDISINNYK